MRDDEMRDAVVRDAVMKDAVMRDEKRNEIEIIKIPPIEGSKKSRVRG